MTVAALSGGATEPAPVLTPISDTDPKYSIYKVTSEVTLTLFRMQNGADSSNTRSMTLKAGTELTVLDVAHDTKAGDLVRLGIDASLSSGLPSDFWVRANDLLAANLQESSIVTNDLSPLEGSLRPLSARGRLRAKSVAVPHIIYSYRFVKEYLVQNKIIPVYLPGSSALQAAKALPEYGFASSNREPGKAKIGDVCVYRGGNGGGGHVEVRRAKGWWYGYGISPASITSLNHQLIGCYAKRGAK